MIVMIMEIIITKRSKKLVDKMLNSEKDAIVKIYKDDEYDFLYFFNF